MKTSNIDRLADVLDCSRRSVLREGRQSHREHLDEAFKTRGRVLKLLSLGFGRNVIVRKLGISKARVQRAYEVLAREGKIYWDESKGGSGGWRVRNV